MLAQGMPNLQNTRYMWHSMGKVFERECCLSLAFFLSSFPKLLFTLAAIPLLLTLRVDVSQTDARQMEL